VIILPICDSLASFVARRPCAAMPTSQNSATNLFAPFPTPLI
jgi:hypothetical protein